MRTICVFSADVDDDDGSICKFYMKLHVVGKVTDL